MGGTVGGLLQADALKSEAEFSAGQLEFNAKLLEAQKRDVKRRAGKDEFRRSQEIRSMLGSQRVSLAAQGIEIDSGVAFEIQEDTRETGRQDIMAIRNNAWREAWGLDVQAMDLRNQAIIGQASADIRGRASIIGGAFGDATTFGLGSTSPFRRTQRKPSASITG